MTEAMMPSMIAIHLRAIPRLAFSIPRNGSYFDSPKCDHSCPRRSPHSCGKGEFCAARSELRTRLQTSRELRVPIFPIRVLIIPIGY